MTPQSSKETTDLRFDGFGAISGKTSTFNIFATDSEKSKNAYFEALRTSSVKLFRS